MRTSIGSSDTWKGALPLKYSRGFGFQLRWNNRNQMYPPTWNNKNKTRQIYETMDTKTLKHQAIKRKWSLKGGKQIKWTPRLPQLTSLRELPSHAQRGETEVNISRLRELKSGAKSPRTQRQRRVHWAEEYQREKNDKTEMHRGCHLNIQQNTDQHVLILKLPQGKKEPSEREHCTALTQDWTGKKSQNSSRNG